MNVHTRRFVEDDTEAVVALWEACGLTRPWNDPRADIARKLSVQPELFRVAVLCESVVGSIMAGYDGHRGWLYYLATDPEHRGRGIATQLVREAEEGLRDLGCPKAQLMVRSDNPAVLDFYERLGYEPSKVSTLGKRLIVD